MTRTDVLILGSGQAGAPLSWRLARAGRRVTLVERGHVGGTCVNTGCTPTKTFIASAQAAHDARRAGDLGVETGTVRVDLAAVVARKERIVQEWRSGVQKNIDETEGLELVRGHARFVGPRRIEVGDVRFEADTVIINVGATNVVPPIEGLDETPYLDNASVMELTRLPRRLVVLGGGYVGCEFAQAFRRFGAEVAVVEAAPHLLAREDADVSETLEAVFRDEGIELHLGAPATSVSGREGSVAVTLDDGTEVEGSHLLLALGRRPATSELGCDAAGVEVDRSGAVVVDAHYRTSADGVYAVGDCTGGAQFTHTAWDDHRILFDILQGAEGRTRSGRLIPWAAFTDPQVAGVGASEKEAEESGTPVRVATFPFRRIARAYEVDRPQGMIKVLIHPETERVVGARVVGAEAAELVTVFQMLMATDAPVTALVDAQMIHPAYVEGLQSAVMTLDPYALS